MFKYYSFSEFMAVSDIFPGRFGHSSPPLPVELPLNTSISQVHCKPRARFEQLLPKVTCKLKAALNHSFSGNWKDQRI